MMPPDIASSVRRRRWGWLFRTGLVATMRRVRGTPTIATPWRAAQAYDEVIRRASASASKTEGSIMTRKGIVFLVALAASMTTAAAKPYNELFPTKVYESQNTQQFVESLDYQQGTITLPAAGVELRVPPKFYFLAAADARRVIVGAWHNPPAMGESVLGIIFPVTHTPADDTWGAVITYDADGYISDEDAANMDYSELLRSMQEATQEANEARVKEGYPSVRLVGWASPPLYDKASNKLYWAKELEFDGQSEHTLNYFVRALGRRGVLNINFVAGMDQLTEIHGVVPAVLAMPEFASGFRYSDYVPSTDKVAAYGIGGLIAGGLAKKLGLLALGLAFLKKGWILAVLALGAAWRSIARWFGGRPRA
jgi:uncharacterized membrane-anchored protein